jgi:uncharacterized membrane protein YkvI
MDRLFRVLLLAFIYIGTVVGAGFASGQEIWFFFSRFQERGTVGLLCSLIVFAWLGPKAMEWGRRMKAESYRDLFGRLVGKRYGWFCDLVMTVFLFILIGIMLAGSGAVTAAFGWGSMLGLWGAVGLTLLVLIQPLAGLKGVNSLVVPLLCLTGLLLSRWGQRSTVPLGGALPVPGGWFLAAVQYSAYNLMLALPVLVTLYRLEADPVLLRWGGVVGGITLGILAFLFHTALKNHDFAEVDLPVLFLTRDWRWGWPVFYSFVLWGELFTSLVANAYGLCARFNLEKNRFYLGQLFLILVVAALVSQFGFAQLITKVYPLSGYFAFTLLLPLALLPLPDEERRGKIQKKQYF